MDLTVLMVEAVIVVGFWVVFLMYFGVTIGAVCDFAEKKIEELEKFLLPDIEERKDTPLRTKDLCPHCGKEWLQIEYPPMSYSGLLDFLPYNLRCSHCHTVIPG